MSAWQPIHAAPKGVSILIVMTATDLNHSCLGQRYVFQAANEDGEGWLDQGCGALENRFWRATHWQPLPEPPPT